MLSALNLETSDGFNIFVENNLFSISPYIFLEQETWFEREANFIRRFLRPGMRAVDVGTNCGYYTLLAASLVGPQGHVWGFEPGTSPARLLRESLRFNAFGNVTLYEAAVGAQRGTIWFTAGNSSELSTVSAAENAAAREVTLESLDTLHGQGELTGIDFIKIDAEGFEEQVVLGGKEFFARENPVVMIEISESEFGPPAMLQAMGYGLYRYNDSLKCLIPLQPLKNGDVVLNVFLCKPQRAETLSAAGLLIVPADMEIDYPPADPRIVQDYFSALAVVKTCPELGALVKTPEEAGYTSALAEFIASQDPALANTERAVRLSRADRYVDENFNDDTSFAHLLSFCRIWIAAGRQGIATVALSTILGNRHNPRFSSLTSVFLPLSPEWEIIGAVGGNFPRWLEAMMVTILESHHSYSSMFEKTVVAIAYDVAKNSGYLEEWLERRAALVSVLTPTGILPDPVFIAGPMRRNKALWHEIALRLREAQKRSGALDLAQELS